MAKKSHVPKFGDWDSDESISYTACFETAQKNEGKGNPNDPEDNPEAFKGMLKSSAAQPPNSATSSSSKPRISSENVRQTEGDTSHGALRPNGVVHERRVSGGSFKSYRSESGSERSNSDYYLMHQQPRHRRARSERKSRLASSGSGRSHSIRSHSISNSPSKPKSTNSSTHQSSNLSQHDTHTRVSSIPKFGDWDDKDPKSGEGFTYIFEKVKEEKKIALEFPVVPQQPSNNLNSANKREKSPSKSKRWCCIF